MAAAAVPSVAVVARGRSFGNLLEDAMSRLAVIALAQHRKQVRDDQKGGRRCEQKAADDGACERGALLLARAADRHRDHADDHRGGSHQYWPNAGMPGRYRSIEGLAAGELLLARKGDEQDRIRRR